MFNVDIRCKKYSLLCSGFSLSAFWVYSTLQGLIWSVTHGWLETCQSLFINSFRYALLFSLMLYIAFCSSSMLYEILLIAMLSGLLLRSYILAAFTLLQSFICKALRQKHIPWNQIKDGFIVISSISGINKQSLLWDKYKADQCSTPISLKNNKQRAI